MSEPPVIPIRAWHHVTLGLLVATFHMLHFLGWSLDDPYITFRYVDHVALGHGLAFNPGEAPVEGYSNLLWLLMLLPWRLLLGSDALMLGAQAMGFTLALATGPLLAWTWQRTGPPAKDAAPLWRWLPLHAWALSSPAMFWAVGGLETALVAFLITAVLFALGEGWDRRIARAPLLALVFLLLTLARPEGAMYGAVYFGVTALGLARRDAAARRAWTLALALFVVGVALYTAWRVRVFGDLLPNTYHAKMGATLGWRLRAGGAYLIACTATTGGLPVFAWLGLWAWPRGAAVRAAVLFALLQIGFVLFVGGDWMPAGRFLVPALPCLLMLGTAGMRRSWDGLTSVTRSRWLRDLLILGLLVWLVASLIGGRYATREIVTLARAPRAPSDALPPGHTELLGPLVEAARWIEFHADADDTLAGEEAGLVPYLTERRFLDLTALNDRHLARQPGDMHGKMDVDYVVNRWRPDWVLLITQPGAAGKPLLFPWGERAAGARLHASEDFQAHYTEVHQIPREFGARVVRVFRRGE